MENEIIIKTYTPYCEETHKRILGVNTDKDGNEFIYQPERLSERTLYNNEEEMRLEEIHFTHE